MADQRSALSRAERARRSEVYVSVRVETRAKRVIPFDRVVQSIIELDT